MRDEDTNLRLNPPELRVEPTRRESRCATKPARSPCKAFIIEIHKTTELDLIDAFLARTRQMNGNTSVGLKKISRTIR